MLKIKLLAVAALAASTALPAWAQTAGPREEIRSAVRGALLPILGDNSADVVRRMQQIKPESQLSRNFNLSKVYSAAFGRSGATPAPDCRVTTTPAGEPDPGDCLYEQGKRDDPTGAYAVLSFSKNLGMGNVKLIKRRAFVAGDGGEPPALKLSDEEAHKRALEFAELLGIPKSEIPVAPAGAKNPLPVRTLAIGYGQDRNTKTIPLQKVVSLQRAFVVPGGLFRDGNTGVVVQHVLGPGAATFVVDDGGVQVARVQGWSDAQMDPKLVPERAKTLSALVDEITDDLYNEGVRKVGSLSVRLALRNGYPHPDDPNPPLCPVCGVLVPSLAVAVSQVGPARVQTSPGNFVAPGLVREYNLVDSSEAERAVR
jgi:hypothetical protein